MKSLMSTIWIIITVTCFAIIIIAIVIGDIDKIRIYSSIFVIGTSTSIAILSNDRIYKH